MRPSLVGLLVACAGCFPSLEPELDVPISCTGDPSVCPAQWSCIAHSELCVPDSIADAAGAALLSPGDNAQVALNSVLLVWGAVNAARFYTVEVSATEDFAATVFSSAGLFTSAEFIPPAAGVYYWRAYADVTSTSPGDLTPNRFFVYDERVRVYCPAAVSDCDAGEVEVGSVTRPFRSIERALQAAQQRGLSEVRVAARGGQVGYDEALVVVEGVNVSGGFDAAFTEPANPAANPTILSPRIEEALRASGVAQPTLISGLSFRAEAGSLLPAARISGVAEGLTVRDCIFETERVDDTGNLFTNVLTISGSEVGPAIDACEIVCLSSPCLALRIDFAAARVTNNTLTSQYNGPNSRAFLGVEGILIAGDFVFSGNQIVAEGTFPAQLKGLGLTVNSVANVDISENTLRLRGTGEASTTFAMEVRTTADAHATMSMNDVRVFGSGAGSMNQGIVVEGEVDVFNNVVVSGGGTEFNSGIEVAGGITTRIVHNTVVINGNEPANLLIAIEIFAAAIVNNLFYSATPGTAALAVDFDTCDITSRPGCLRGNVFGGALRAAYENACDNPGATIDVVASLGDLDGLDVLWFGDGQAITTSRVSGNSETLLAADALFVDATGPDADPADWFDADLRLSGALSGGVPTDEPGSCSPTVDGALLPAYTCGNVTSDFDGNPRAAGAPTPGAFEAP